jgi:predicted nucleic acid-binding protein
MPILVDTNILLRVLNRDDAQHALTRNAVRSLKSRGEQNLTTLQNVSEFWNVCTRPQAARGGLGLNPEEAERRLRILERSFTVLPEPPNLYSTWRQLVVSHSILGVQVHDAKLVAAMMLHGITDILTFNGKDFARYPGINAISP